MKIVYWSSTGNTERMAQMLGEELEKLGGSAEVEEVSSVSPSALEKETVFALGCSAMGDEELDEGGDGALRAGGGEVCFRQKNRSFRFL